MTTRRGSSEAEQPPRKRQAAGSIPAPGWSLASIGVALISASTVVFCLWVYQVFNIPKLWLASLGCLLAAASPRPLDRRGEAVWAVFLGVFVLTTATSVDPVLSIDGFYLAGWETLTLALLCWLAYEAGLTGAGSPHRLALYAGLAGALHCISQVVGLDPWAWSVPVSSRAFGPMGNATFSGGLCALAMAWTSSWPALAVLGAGIAATGTRAAILAAAAVLVYRYRSSGSRALRLGIVMAAMLACAAMMNRRRLLASENSHLGHVRAAVVAFTKRPILGWGPATGSVWYIGTRDAVTVKLMGAKHIVPVNAHNLPANILATQGLLGAAAWVLLLAAAWRVAGEATRTYLVGLLVFGMFQPITHVSYVLAALMVGRDRASGLVVPRDGRPTSHPWHGTAVACVAALVFSSLSWTLLAERHAGAARVLENSPAAGFHWAKAADMKPWEPFYSEHASDRAIGNLWWHRGNPMVYPGAARALRETGRNQESSAILAEARKILEAWRR